MSHSVYSPEYQSIIKRLKAARLERNLKQSEVAHKLDKPQSYVSKIERGERRMDAAELKRFAEIYKKPVGYFLQ